MLERRVLPRRRARDLLATAAPKPALDGRWDLYNHLLLVDDDLRETALALQGVESYLLRVRGAIVDRAVTGLTLDGLAAERSPEVQLDEAAENLERLKQRLGTIARLVARGR